MDFKKTIASALAKHLDFLKEKEILEMLETPPKPELGDLAFPCFSLAKQLKQKPQDIAEDLQKKLGELNGISKIETFNGYLNFFTDSSKISSNLLKDILRKRERFGRTSFGKGKKIMVEYSAPNANKPLHLGHLRNDSLGMALTNLLEFSGYKVVRANLVNDRGIHICQSMLAYEKWGQEKTPEDAELKGDKFVGNFYVLFHQKAKEQALLEKEAGEMLKKWEDKDPSTRDLWKKMREWVLTGFNQTYEVFGSKFDEFFFESDLYDKAGPLIDVGLTKKVFFKDEDGKIVASLKKHGLPDKVVLRADGTGIYLTQDLPLTKHKFEKFDLDKAIWVVASEQNLYFKQLFKILELLGFKWAKSCEHLSYGLVFLPEGKMKSREGKIIDADDLISDVKALAEEEILKREKLGKKELEERSLAIALAAIKFAMLHIDYKKDFTFVPEKSISFEGESGPYLQYSFARAQSILRKLKKPVDLNKVDFSLLSSEKEERIIKLLSEFEQITSNAVEKRQLHLLCHYLLGLCNEFNSFYHESQVLKAEEELKNARIALTEAFAQVLKNGLLLLNIVPLDKM